MQFKLFVVPFILFANYTILAVPVSKYDHISECFYQSGPAYDDNVTFVCGEVNNEERIFSDSDALTCSAGTHSYNYFGKIDFMNCHFSEIKRNLVNTFSNLQNLILADTGLETLKSTILDGAIYLSKFNASHNRLTEIQSQVFIKAGNVTNIDLNNNKINKIDASAFEGAPKIKVLDLSVNALSIVHEQLFKHLPNLEVLNLSQNTLREIPLGLLANSKELSVADFSSNNLQRIDHLAFGAVTKLKRLDLSHNRLTKIPVLPNLSALHLSNNDLTSLDEHTFDTHSNLESLNLSFNPIGNLKIGTFTRLINLQELSLREINLSTIELGTFVHQKKLVSLDLRNNNMKYFDFIHFWPVQYALESLQLGGNQIKHLNRFRASLLPKLNLLDIQNNDFDCSFIVDFFQRIDDWPKYNIHLDTSAINPEESSILGINCENPSYEDINDIETDLKPQQHLEQHALKALRDNNDKFMKISMIFICVIMSSYFVIFLILNMSNISMQFRDLRNHPYASNQNRPLSSTASVEYSREQMLLE